MLIPSSPADRKVISDAVKEADRHMTIKDAAADGMKEIFDALKDKKVEITKRQFNKMVTVYHKQNFQEEVQLAEDFADLYEQVMK